jgi:medium-chain acyl-[acyl-carrier-protein] hydrolase
MTMPNNVSTGANRWFAPLKPGATGNMRLFCFPYAGGSSNIYREWPKYLPPNVEVWVAKLPGRDNRLKETPYTDLATLADAFAQAMVSYLDKPFVFFGHSMGAMLSYELSRLLRSRRGVEPAHLIVSARRAPQLPDTAQPTYNLPDAEFIEEVRRLNGTPKEVLEHAELMQMVLPLLRADFSVCETYTHTPGPTLECPLTVLGGIQDVDISREHLEAWRELTRGPFSLRILPGEHFFIHTAQPLVLRIVAQELLKVSRA